MKPTIVILVGITGDLATRKLIPALDGLREKGLLPEHYKLVGVTRRDGADHFKMDLDSPEDYQRLKEHLESIEKEWSTTAQRLFYLSVAPTISLSIIKLLGSSGLASVPDTKLLLEKPFGLDEKSAQAFIDGIDANFSEEQVYRIDHYLAKESVRALAAQQIDTNGLERIEVTASEKIGIEGRGSFYEQTGALRDFIQSHLLEVAAMAISPTSRVRALKQLYIDDDAPLTTYVQREQYIGYREAVSNPESVVETKVSVTLKSHDPLLTDVSIVLKTGKALDHKGTDISLLYKDGAFEIISLDDTHNAYEHVFADAMQDKKEFFISKEEVMETWRILTPIQETWAKDSTDLDFYEQGSAWTIL